MMKKLMVIGIVSMMVLGMAAASHAAAVDQQWMVQLAGFASAGSGSCFNTLNAGTSTQANVMDASDGVDTLDAELSLDNNDQIEVVSTDMPAGDPSKGPRFSVDKRLPMNDTTNLKQVWNILLFTGAQYSDPNSSFVLKVWQPTTIGSFNARFDGTGFTKLALYEGGEKGTQLWDFLAHAGTYTTSASPAFSKTYSPKTRTAGGYQLTLVAETSVPEPGSMVAMLSGLVGLVGYGIRRRK